VSNEIEIVGLSERVKTLENDVERFSVEMMNKENLSLIKSLPETLKDLEDRINSLEGNDLSEPSQKDSEKLKTLLDVKNSSATLDVVKVD